MYDPLVLSVTQLVRFGDKVLENGGVPVLRHAPAKTTKICISHADWAYRQIERERRSLQISHQTHTKRAAQKQLQQQVRSIADGLINIAELSGSQRAKN